MKPRKLFGFIKIFVLVFAFNPAFPTKFNENLTTKYKISTPLIIENPVRRPIVPPIADNTSINLAALSLVILSNVGVSK